MEQLINLLIFMMVFNIVISIWNLFIIRRATRLMLISLQFIRELLGIGSQVKEDS